MGLCFGLAGEVGTVGGDRISDWAGVDAASDWEVGDTSSGWAHSLANDRAETRAGVGDARLECWVEWAVSLLALNSVTACTAAELLEVS